MDRVRNRESTAIPEMHYYFPLGGDTSSFWVLSVVVTELFWESPHMWLKSNGWHQEISHLLMKKESYCIWDLDVCLSPKKNSNNAVLPHNLIEVTSLVFKYKLYNWAMSPHSIVWLLLRRQTSKFCEIYKVLLKDGKFAHHSVELIRYTPTYLVYSVSHGFVNSSVHQK